MYIPITTIGIREDGEGYGGSHKFEMTQQMTLVNMLNRYHDLLTKNQ